MSSDYRKIVRRLRSPLEVVAICLARLLFPWCTRRQILRLARGVGDLGYAIDYRDRRIASANLKLIFGERLTPRRRRALLRLHFRHVARVMLDIAWFAHDGRARIGRWSRFDSDVVEWLRTNPGGIMVTGHLGNWEVAGQTVAAMGYPITSVAKQIGSPGTTRLLNRFRHALGQKIVMSAGAVRGLVNALRAGDYIALLIDQHVEPRDGGIWIDFFGLSASVSSMAARLAIKFNRSIMVCYAQAMPDGSYRGRLLGVCHPAAGDDPARMTQRIIDLMADAIRRHPSQWLVSYKRWKRCPQGADITTFPFYCKPAPEQQVLVE